MNCELCGRPAKALVRARGPKAARKSRNGVPRAMPNHSLCQECWAKQGASIRTRAALAALVGRESEEDRLRGVIRAARVRLEAGDSGGALDALREAA